MIDDDAPKADGTADNSVTSYEQSGGITAHTININSRDPLFEAQLAELNELDRFIGRRSETELRDTFDLRDILTFNVRLQRESLTGQKDDKVDAFFEDGGGRISLTKVVIHPRPDGGAHHVEPIPGHIYWINISQKYLESRRKLMEFADSMMMPSEVVEAIREMDRAIERNSDLMLEVLDERFRANPKNIVEHEDTNSSRCGGINNAYWHKFENLKPLAEEVGSAIRKYLEVA